jgi:integrase
MRENTTSSVWQWPVQIDKYNRCPELTETEAVTLKAFVQRTRGRGIRAPALTEIQQKLSRLVEPICEALGAMQISQRYPVVSLLLAKMHQEQCAYWAFSEKEWSVFFSSDWKQLSTNPAAVHSGQFIAVLYLLGLVRDWRIIEQLLPRPWDTAKSIFGSSQLESNLVRLVAALESQGYAIKQKCDLTRFLAISLLAGRSPYLEDISLELLDNLYQGARTKAHQDEIKRLTYSLFVLGLVPRPIEGAVNNSYQEKAETTEGIHPDWVAICRRWLETSTLTTGTRRSNYRQLMTVGRWLAETHPVVTKPDQWTADIAQDFVVMVENMRVGNWASRQHKRVGEPLKATTKSGLIYVARRFFNDCQEWGWAKLAFNPQRRLQPSDKVLSQLGPAPRVIADDIWAKLLWAGLNLTTEDVLACQSVEGYPIEMIQALATVWLFGGLRMDEIRRLRFGCIRWQYPPPDEGKSLTEAEDAVCLLTVPANKTGSAFVKPVDPIIGRSIEAWEAVRPIAGPTLDRKTNEIIHYLFNCRGRLLYRGYINQKLIPLMCRKAGMPEEDARGRITSHRARATIASQLYNAKEGMSLAELQAWLGHRTPESTRHYVAVTPTKQAKSYAEAGYLDQNQRLINVLIDQEAVRSGAAHRGEAWRYYDVGHGHCTYDFFDQCAHRLACARCSFYVPKTSSQSQLLQAKAHLEKMIQVIALNDYEQAAVEDGILVVEKLLAHLSEVRTPDSSTPRQLGQRTPSMPTVVSFKDIEVK